MTELDLVLDGLGNQIKQYAIENAILAAKLRVIEEAAKAQDLDSQAHIDEEVNGP